MFCTDLLRRYRWCSYYGAYFCLCCHDGDVSYVPAHIMHSWDFTKYPVSNFARDLLVKLNDRPVFSVTVTGNDK